MCLSACGISYLFREIVRLREQIKSADLYSLACHEHNQLILFIKQKPHFQTHNNYTVHYFMYTFVNLKLNVSLMQHFSYESIV